MGFKIFKTPVKFHWSAGILFLFALPISKDIESLLTSLVCIVMLIIVHESGHAVVCRLLKYPVVSIEVNGLGGRCYYTAPYSIEEFHHSLIAWGGILFQLVLLGLTLLAVFVMSKTGFVLNNIFYDSILTVFIGLNTVMIFINLIPYAELDGKAAWRLFPQLVDSRRFKKNAVSKKKVRPVTKKQERAKEIIDELMQKITGEGMDALTGKEKKQLEWARKHYKLEKV